MRGRELLGVARLLERAAGHPPNEPAGRSAVNRAYYAAFGEASDYAHRIGYSHAGGPGSHNRVWKWIGAYSDGNATRDAGRRAAASQGMFLKARRQKADYRLAARLGRGEATAALKESERIIRTLDSL